MRASPQRRRRREARVRSPEVRPKWPTAPSRSGSPVRCRPRSPRTARRVGAAPIAAPDGWPAAPDRVVRTTKPRSDETNPRCSGATPNRDWRRCAARPSRPRRRDDRERACRATSAAAGGPPRRRKVEERNSWLGSDPIGLALGLKRLLGARQVHGNLHQIGGGLAHEIDEGAGAVAVDGDPLIQFRPKQADAIAQRLFEVTRKRRCHPFARRFPLEGPIGDFGDDLAQFASGAGPHAVGFRVELPQHALAVDRQQIGQALPLGLEIGDAGLECCGLPLQFLFGRQKRLAFEFALKKQFADQRSQAQPSRRHKDRALVARELSGEQAFQTRQPARRQRARVVRQLCRRPCLAERAKIRSGGSVGRRSASTPARKRSATPFSAASRRSTLFKTKKTLGISFRTLSR